MSKDNVLQSVLFAAIATIFLIAIGQGINSGNTTYYNASATDENDLNFTYGVATFFADTGIDFCSSVTFNNQSELNITGNFTTNNCYATLTDSSQNNTEVNVTFTSTDRKSYATNSLLGQLVVFSGFILLAFVLYKVVSDSERK